METLDLVAPSTALGVNRYKAILRLAMPTVLAMLSQTLVNEIDVVYFSHLPLPESSNGQAALLPSLILTWLFGGSLCAISVGTQALVARRYAEGNRAAAGAVLANATFFAVVAGAAFTAVGMACLPSLIGLMVKAPEVKAIALSYTRWRLLGVISMAASMAIKAFFDGIGRTHVHLVSAIAMNAINVVLCWAFIFGHLGAPRMGPEGAGVSAFLATWVGLGIMVLYAALVRRDYHPMRWANLSGKVTWSILKLSIPAAAATVFMMLGFLKFTEVVGQLDAHGGAEAVNSAANTDIVAILKLTFTACMAFGTATATLIGQSLGRHDPNEAQKWGWASVRLGVAIFAVVGLCEGFLFTHQLVALISNSTAVRAAAIFPMRIMGIATPVIAVAMILSEGLFGAGSTRFVAGAQLLLVVWLVLSAFVLGIVLQLGLEGIWVAVFVYCCLTAMTMGAKFAGGSWKTIRL
jgi:multidrug resistance protein, MATE family